MDAAQSNQTKFVLYFAAALLLTAPFQASAQTLNVSTTSLTLGSSACNNSQTVSLTSSGGSNSPVTFSVAVNYPNGTANGDNNGNWLYTTVSGVGTTSTGTPFTDNTGQNGVTLNVGLNRSLLSTSDTGQVIVTPTNPAATPITITVFYSQNTSCGGNTGSISNNFITVTPGNVSLTSGTSGSDSVTLGIQNITGSGYAFNIQLSPTNSWLTVTYSSVTISPNGTTSLTVAGSASQTNGVGTYNGTISLSPQTGYGGTTLNIPVVFTVTSGSSSGGGNSTGTLTVNGATSSTFTDTFEYVAPNPPSSQCIPIQDTAANANSYTATASTSNGGSWLFVNNQITSTTPQLLAPSYNACVNLSLNPGVAYGLASGAYQGSVAITSSSGSTATINVNYYVSAGAAQGVSVSAQGQSGSALVFVFPNVPSNSTVIQQQNLTVTGVQGVLLGTPNITGQANGFSLSNPTANGNSLTFTVTSNATGLVTGVYASTITLTSTANNQTGTTTITVVQPVGQGGTTTTGGGTTTSQVAPQTLAFQQQFGSSYWTSAKEAQAVTITGAQGTQWSASIVYASGSAWLNFDSASSGTFGSGPATLLVDLSNGVTSLQPQASAYQATVSIVTPGGTINVAVSLLVTAANTPVLLGYPASTTFNATTGTNPANQTATIVGSDNTASTNSPPISAGAPTATWLTATTSGNTLTLAANPSGLGTGIYSATVPVTASAYSNAVNYPVIMIVNGGGNGGTTGPLTLSPPSLNFTNVTSQISQTFNVSASSSTQFTLSSSESTCTSSTWLQVVNGGYSANSTPQGISVTVNPAGINTGSTCTGVLSLVTTGSNGGTQTVTVSMTVGTSSGSGNVTVTPTTLSFPYTAGGTVPAAQTVTIVNAISGTASISFSVATSETNGTGVTWLQASTSSAQTPYNSPGLSISVAPGNLPANTYTGTVTITPTGGTAVVINVTMTISATATVTATPTTVTWNYIAGGNAPTGATIQVSAGGAVAPFTATAVSTGGWLQVSPISGNTPNTGTANLTVSTVASALASLLPSATPYTGTITVQGVTQGGNQATGTTVINVSLTVSAPLPVISGIINTASGVGGTSNVTVSPGEIISLFAPNNGQNPFGPSTAVQLSSTTCPSPCTVVPNNMGGVQVFFLPGNFAAPLLYVSGSQINAVVPYQVAGIGNLSVEVKYLGQTSNAFPLTVATTSPGLFSAVGSTQAAAYQYDTQGNGSYNSAATPAKAGWTLVLYVTGEGVVVPAATSGGVTQFNSSANPPVPVPAAGAPTVRIGPQPATVSFYGEAPGFVSGLMQLNVVVPAGAGTGAVPVVVTVGGNSTQAGTTVALQ